MSIGPPSIHCVIVDDHLMLLQLLVGIVRTVPSLVVVGTATDVSDAERVASLDRIDLLIVDRRLGSADGIDFLRTVIARHPAVRCIVIAGSTADFVCPPDLMQAVVSVVDKSHACETLLAEIGRAMGVVETDGAEHLTKDEIRSRLTPRELELFTALGEGLSNKEIGQRFGISTRTVETHRKSISRKLRSSGAALVRLATIHQHIRLDGDLHASQPADRSASTRVVP